MRSDVDSDKCCFLLLFCRRFFPFAPAFILVVAVAAGEPVTDVVASELPSGLDSLSSVSILKINTIDFLTHTHNIYPHLNVMLPFGLSIPCFFDGVTLARPPLRLSPLLLILFGVLVPLSEDGSVRTKYLPLHNFIKAHRFFAAII